MYLLCKDGVSMLSVILPVYNEEKQIEKTVNEIKSIISGLNEGFEIIVVDDGSTDNTWDVLKDLAGNPEVSVYRFSRNFGKEAAIMPAFPMGRRCMYYLDGCRLQHPPELILKWYGSGRKALKLLRQSKGQGQEHLLNAFCVLVL